MTETKTRLEAGEVLIREGLFKFPSSPEGKPRLIGAKCARCGNHVFPKLDFCPKCKSDQPLDEVELSTRGKIFTYTVARQAFPGFEIPYVIAAVRLPEGVDVVSHIQTSDVDSVRIGQEVEICVGPIKTNMSGDKVISYKFTPVNSKNGRRQGS